MEGLVALSFVSLFLTQVKLLSWFGKKEKGEEEEGEEEEEEEEELLRPLRKQSVPVSSPRRTQRVWSSVEHITNINGGKLPTCFGICMTIGQRKTMEDHATVALDLVFSGDVFIGVFDGHGTDKVAAFCAENLHALVQQDDLLIAEGDAQKRWSHVYNAMHQRIGLDIGKIGGTCAVTVLVRKGCIEAANVGDSRALLISPRGVQRLSYDHKANDPMEEAAIKARGGVVFGGRLSGILQVSRTLGDLRGDKYISRVPHVQSVAACKGDVLLLASDGLFEVTTDEEVGAIVGQLYNNGAQAIADALLELTVERKSLDNVSIVVYFLNE